MAILNLISVAQAPKGPWAWILLELLEFVTNYGWRVVLFTVLLKLVLSPLDIYQRYKARQNQKIAIRLRPDMEKLQKIYGHDPQLLSRKQMELNKKSGMSMFSSCLPAIVTLVIFITLLYTGLQPISQYKNFTEYETLNAEYHRAYDEAATSGEYNMDTEEDRKAVISIAQDAVKELYESEVKESFLWVKNVWSADVPWTAPINDYAKFKTNIGKYATDYEKAGFESEEQFNAFISEAEYKNVMGKLLDDPEYNKSNGYLVLPVLTILLSVAMQIVSFRQQKNSGQSNAQSEMQMKMMMLIMPIMMGFFALSYTAAFSIYLVMNYVGSLVIALTSALILKIIDAKADHDQLTQVQKYGRPDFSDRKNDNQ